MQAIPFRNLLLLLLLFSLAATDASSQSKRRITTRRRKATSGSVRTRQNNQVRNPATGNLVTLPSSTPGSTPTDTTQPQRPDNIFGVIDTVKEAERPDNVVNKYSNKDRVPLSYQYIRQDDAIWGHRLWEEIDVHEKMNLPFQYSADEDGSSQIFINILLNAIRKGEVTAFDPIDDRFTTPMTISQVARLLHGKPDTILVPNPITGVDSQEVIEHDFDPMSVTRYQIKEDWVFDKQTSQLYVRILGIAPLKAIYNNDGSFRAMTPMFWLYYPDLRPVLARHDVYNPHNFMMRMSWEDLFEMRYFEAYVVKEDNVFDRSIKDYIHNGVNRLEEGKRIKNDIFNWEQSLWQY